mgnify:CR=1 FL=1
MKCCPHVYTVMEEMVCKECGEPRGICPECGEPTHNINWKKENALHKEWIETGKAQPSGVWWSI